MIWQRRYRMSGSHEVSVRIVLYSNTPFLTQTQPIMIVYFFIYPMELIMILSMHYGVIYGSPKESLIFCDYRSVIAKCGLSSFTV